MQLGEFPVAAKQINPLGLFLSLQADDKDVVLFGIIALLEADYSRL